MMSTLYDLLGALPKDSAEDLRTAFRRAVKGAHPDLHPGDPDAALKFREIVRANEILGDVEQREVYDHLLDLAQLEQVSASKQATAARFHRVTSGIIALAGVSVMTAGSYLLFMHMSAASLGPAEKAAPIVLASAAVGPPPVTTENGAAIAKDEGAGIPGRAVEPSATIPQTNTEPVPAAIAGPIPDRATADAGPARARGASTPRIDNPNSAIADLGQASLSDPKFSPAGRGVIFYRLRKFDRAFADLAPTKQIKNPGRARSASATRVGPAAIARPPIPVPRRRPLTQDPSRQESMASARLP